MSKRLRLVAVGGVLALALALGIWIVLERLHRLPEDAALRAGDTVVTEEQLSQRVHVLEALYGVRPPSDKASRAEFDKDAAKSMAVSLVLEGAAKDRGVVISGTQAQDALRKLVAEQLSSGMDGFVDFLRAEGIPGCRVHAPQRLRSSWRARPR